MKTTILPTPIEGLVVVEIDFFRDARGFFIEPWHKMAFAEAGLDLSFVQSGHSGSSFGVLRGLHYQDMTAPMGKLVRCTVGRVFDVAVDLRVGSPTFGKWFGIELSEENMKQVWVPSGFAHGFLALSKDVKAQFQYMQSGFYTPSSEGGLIWNDPDVGIAWPLGEYGITEDLILANLSKKDQNQPTLKQYLENPKFFYGKTPNQ